MFSSLFTSLKKYCNKRNILFILFISLVFLSLSDITFADNPNQGDYGATITSESKTGASAQKNTDYAMRGLASLLATLTFLASLFMHPGWYSGEVFNLNVYMKQIWILISNVVYFIFAILLIWVALMNIIGRGGDYELKKQLPKFIVGILMVPFSWFMVQFVLSLSSVLTVAMLSLPYDTFKDYKAFENTGIKIPTKCELNMGATAGTSTDGGANAGKTGEYFNCKDEIDVKELMGGGSDSKGGYDDGIFGLLSIYTYGILKVDKVDTIFSNQVMSPDGLKSLLSLSFKTLMSLVFVLVFALLMFALFLAMFMRGVRLWIYMMASPLFGLIYYMGGAGKLGSLGKINIKDFISLAMVPVYVAAALSFGLLFIFVTAQGLESSGKGGNNTESGLLACKKEGNSKVPSCTAKLGKFELKFSGVLGSAGNVADQGSEVISSAFGQMILQFFGIAVLWIAVMAALNSNEITKAIVSPISEFGGHVGSMAAKLPSYAPIPLPGLGGMSFDGLGKLGGDFSNKMEEMQTSRYRDIRDSNPLFSGLAPKNEGTSDSYKAMLKPGLTQKETSNAFIEALKQTDLEDIAHLPPTGRQALKQYSGIDVTDKKTFEQAVAKISSDPKFRDVFGGSITENDVIDRVGKLKEGTEGAASSVNNYNNVSFSFPKDANGKTTVTDSNIGDMQENVRANLAIVGASENNKLSTKSIQDLIIAKGGVSPADATKIITAMKGNEESKKIFND